MVTKRHIRWLLIVFWVVIGARAQQIPTSKGSQTSTVHLDVVVMPKGGGLAVTGLQQEDFSVLDNKSPQPIRSFQAVDGRQASANIIMVIDAVNTSYQQVAFERGEIEKFLRADGGHLAHPIQLAVVTDTGSQIQETSSSDGNTVGDALEHYEVGLRDIHRSAGIYGDDERFRICLKALDSMVSSVPASSGRTMIFWMSPGWPLLTGPNIQLGSKQQEMIFSSIVDLSTRLREARVTLYSLNPLGVDQGIGRAHYYEQFVKGISKPSQVQLGDLSVQALAEQSGGLALSSTGVAEMLQQSMKDADSYYELTFQALPAEKRNEYHSVEVKLTKPGLVGRTRQGYYAQP
jgi:VWFA-related protein